MNDLVRRAAATEKTLAKYRARPFSWEGASCIHLARSHAVNLGHRGLPRLPTIRSAIGAKRALRDQGVADLVELFDRHFIRLPAPAFMQLGDIALLPGDADGMHAVVIFDGISSLLGWHESAPEGLRPIKNAMQHIVAAYRI